MSKELKSAIIGFDHDESLRLTAELLANGNDPFSLLEECREAMDIVGQRFEKGEFFLTELMMSGMIVSEISKIIKPSIENKMTAKNQEKIVIGTVQGDIHNIGKDIVILMLNSSGFEVIDLGVDVPPKEFVDAIREYKPKVLGLSGLLTLAYESARTTIKEIENAGLRNDLKIMIGGAVMDDRVKEFVGADAYGKDAIAGVVLAKKWTGKTL